MAETVKKVPSCNEFIRIRTKSANKGHDKLYPNAVEITFIMVQVIVFS